MFESHSSWTKLSLAFCQGSWQLQDRIIYQQNLFSRLSVYFRMQFCNSYKTLNADIQCWENKKKWENTAIEITIWIKLSKNNRVRNNVTVTMHTCIEFNNMEIYCASILALLIFQRTKNDFSLLAKISPFVLFFHRK